jgi:hypothetical protein
MGATAVVVAVAIAVVKAVAKAIAIAIAVAVAVAVTVAVAVAPGELKCQGWKMSLSRLNRQPLLRAVAALSVVVQGMA